MGRSGPVRPLSDSQSPSLPALLLPNPPLVRGDPEQAPAPFGRSDGCQGFSLSKRLFQSRTGGLSHTGSSFVRGAAREHRLSPPLRAPVWPLSLRLADLLRLFPGSPLLYRASYSPCGAEARLQPQAVGSGYTVYRRGGAKGGGELLVPSNKSWRGEEGIQDLS
ncbi:hypothetical protein NDU88_003896 [Pleurodeles waltl]|uniref:Uncharacterized protein n=1 Tax=Pleurodeles waltl TaxID=8319 RepID=A0AAV7V0B2_PLEWA|nr:hypothetical protein NDU88_003896 [Pleurodeles waltl]